MIKTDYNLVGQSIVIRTYNNDQMVSAEEVPLEQFTNVEILEKIKDGGVYTVKEEMVNHPKHYGGDTEYECIKVLKVWNTRDEFIGFCKDNTIKYLCRSGKKDEILQEYKKAQWYLNQLVDYLESK